MPSSIGGLPTPNGAAAPRVRQDIEDLADAVDLVSIPVLANTTNRDAAYAAAIAAGKVGMRCYITNRAGYCTYVHNTLVDKAWQWESQNRVLASFYDAFGAAPALEFGSFGAIFPTITVVLPPGQRLVRVEFNAIGFRQVPSVISLYGRVDFTGSNIGPLNGQSLPFVLDPAPDTGLGFSDVNLSACFTARLTGTFALTVNITMIGGDARPAVRSASLTVVDLGPVD